MNKIHTEFDRTLHKTHKSRYTKFTPSENRGFTLIELLVVISIIALLSTVVLAAVNDARVKGRNTGKNSAVLEYVKALELYRNDNGSYPVTGATPICFGYSTGQYCYADAYEGSTTIKNAMQNYIGGNFAHTAPVLYGSSDLKGVQYLCNGSTTCTSYTLYWYNEKTGQKCVGNTSGNNEWGHTRCTYLSK